MKPTGVETALKNLCRSPHGGRGLKQSVEVESPRTGEVAPRMGGAG